MKKSLLSTLILSISLVACNGGSGGSSGTGGNGGSGSGGNGNGSNTNNSTITKLQVLSPNAGSTYSNTCIFNNNVTTTLINGDGSGNGYSININTGTISPVSNFPKINITSDVCLDNFMELTWYNKSDKTTLNVLMNQGNNVNKTVNLTGTGITGSDMDIASFNVFGDGSGIIANNTFQLQANFGFSSLNMTNFIPSGLFSGIDNSQYIRSNSSRMLYGFDGNGDTASQILNTDGNLPSILVSYQPTPTGSGITRISKITDSNGNAIAQMSGGWDYATTGKGIVIVSGLVQPDIYNCSAKVNQDSSVDYICGAPIVNTDLLKKYKMMRVLGATPTTLYFMGMDLANQQIAIFSMSI